MSSTRIVGVFLLGLFVGAAAGSVGMIFFLRSDVGAGVIAQYISTQPQWPDIAPQQSASTTEAIQQFVSGRANIPVPKSYASATYTTALNATLRETALIAASSTELAQLLLTINNKSLQHDYTGFFDLIVQAKAQVGIQSSRVARLGQDITALNVANQNTSDPRTKSQTIDLVKQGQSLQTALQSYTDTLNQMLSGSVPTAEQVQSLKDQATTLEPLATNFANAIKVLEQYLIGSQQQ